MYGYMIGEAHICPGKCHEDKPLHIPLEIINAKYVGTRSCPLRIVDFESLRPQDVQPILYVQMLQGLMILETFLIWLGIFENIIFL